MEGDASEDYRKYGAERRTVDKEDWGGRGGVQKLK